MNKTTKVKMYLNSFSTKLAIFVGTLMYLTYGFKERLFTNLYLIGVCLFVAIFLPHFTKLVDKIEKKLEFMSGKLIFGKLGRFVPQLGFNLVVMVMFLTGHVVHANDLARIGGPLGAAVLTTLASQGLQYVGLVLSNRDVGNRYANVTIAISLNSVVTALAALGFNKFQRVFILGGIIFGVIGVGYSLITDAMSMFAPKGGIGIFFGTFNPVHTTHIKLIKEFIESRNLEKVYVHPTVIPKGHQQMLNNNVIRIARMEGGMRFYETTEKADVHVNYFPTGNKFFEIENRIVMLKAAIKDSDLNDKVEVICYPEIYSKDGFYGVIKIIKSKCKGKHIHGLHGSDVGGMLVRAIYDECLGIWPYPVRRTDNVSATAIRKGAVGMTSPSTTKILEFLNCQTESAEIEVQGENYIFTNQRLLETVKIEKVHS